MSKHTKAAFPKWMVAASIASGLALIAVGWLAAKMFAVERNYLKEEKKMLAEYQASVASQTQQPSQEIRSVNPPQTIASDEMRKWESVFAQVNHPYVKAQLEELMEIPDLAAQDLDQLNFDDATDVSSKPVWVQLPVALAKFTLSNRKLLDSAYELVVKREGDSSFSPQFPLQLNSMSDLSALAFFDAVQCLTSKEQERFKTALDFIWELPTHYGLAYYNNNNNDRIVFLLHGALDKKLLTLEETSQWLDRMKERVVFQQVTSSPSVSEDLRAAVFHTFNEAVASLQILPSVKRRMFEDYFWRSYGGASVPASSRALNRDAQLRYYGLAVRIALLQAIQERKVHPKIPEDILSRLELPAGVLQALEEGPESIKQDMHAFYSYKENGPDEGELTLQVPINPSYPTAKSYRVQVPTP